MDGALRLSDTLPQTWAPLPHANPQVPLLPRQLAGRISSAETKLEDGGDALDVAHRRARCSAALVELKASPPERAEDLVPERGRGLG